MKRISLSFRIISVLCAVALTVIPTAARKIKTTRPGVKKSTTEAVEATTVAVAADSVEGCVTISGYDKQLRSHVETFFVTNSTHDSIEGIIFTSQFFNADGMPIHKVRRRLDIAIPAGETRRADIQSWDRQRSFYYIGSKRPRIPASSYNIIMTLDSIILRR